MRRRDGCRRMLTPRSRRCYREPGRVEAGVRSGVDGGGALRPGWVFAGWSPHGRIATVTRARQRITPTEHAKPCARAPHPPARLAALRGSVSSPARARMDAGCPVPTANHPCVPSTRRSTHAPPRTPAAPSSAVDSATKPLPRRHRTASRRHGVVAGWRHRSLWSPGRRVRTHSPALPHLTASPLPALPHLTASPLSALPRRTPARTLPPHHGAVLAELRLRVSAQPESQLLRHRSGGQPASQQARKPVREGAHAGKRQRVARARGHALGKRAQGLGRNHSAGLKCFPPASRTPSTRNRPVQGSRPPPEHECRRLDGGTGHPSDPPTIHPPHRGC